jgi:hypothetical protein
MEGEMLQFSSHLDVLGRLPKTNCRECRLASCLAFSIAVCQGKNNIQDCPYLGSPENRKEVNPIERDMEIGMKALQNRIRGIDWSAAAERCGGKYNQGKLALSCLGKPFSVDEFGIIHSDCHVNRWVSFPILNYILDCAGREPKGEWIPLRETKGGADWWRLFGQRCEKPLKKVIDDHTELLEWLVEIFAGEPAPEMFNSNISVVIYPLPLLPILLCYWKSEEGMDSSLHLFFDISAEENLNIESIYSLCLGMVTMFEKIALTHGK